MDKIIEGVIVTDLKIIGDEKGSVMHMLRCDDPVFEIFGEIYFSKILPGAVRPWKMHKKMTLNLAAPSGKVRLVLYDSRKSSKTRGVGAQIILSEKNYKLVTVPPRIWFGFEAIGGKAALLANCATLPHEASEVERLDSSSSKIPYQWANKNARHPGKTRRKHNNKLL